VDPTEKHGRTIGQEIQYDECLRNETDERKKNFKMKGDVAKEKEGTWGFADRCNRRCTDDLWEQSATKRKSGSGTKFTGIRSNRRRMHRSRSFTRDIPAMKN